MEIKNFLYRITIRVTMLHVRRLCIQSQTSLYKINPHSILNLSGQPAENYTSGCITITKTIC
jgi:hypothetical protein